MRGHKSCQSQYPHPTHYQSHSYLSSHQTPHNQTGGQSEVFCLKALDGQKACVSIFVTILMAQVMVRQMVVQVLVQCLG